MSRYRVEDVSRTFNTTGDDTPEATDLGGAVKYSEQVIVGVSGVGGKASLTFQKSNDAANWTNIQDPTHVAVSGTTWLEVDEPSYRYYRSTVSGVGGGVDITKNTVIIQD